MKKQIFIVIIVVIVLSVTNSYACSRDSSLLTKETQIKLNQLKTLASKENIDFKVICTYRSQKEQDKLYAKGRTSPGRKVTWSKKSKHTLRIAFDVVMLKSNKLSWNGKDYLRLGELGKKLNLLWGGSWKARDYGHFELKEVN